MMSSLQKSQLPVSATNLSFNNIPKVLYWILVDWTGVKSEALSCSYNHLRVTFVWRYDTLTSRNSHWKMESQGYKGSGTASSDNETACATPAVTDCYSEVQSLPRGHLSYHYTTIAGLHCWCMGRMNSRVISAGVTSVWHTLERVLCCGFTDVRFRKRFVTGQFVNLNRFDLVNDRSSRCVFERIISFKQSSLTQITGAMISSGAVSD